MAALVMPALLSSAGPVFAQDTLLPRLLTATEARSGRPTQRQLPAVIHCVEFERTTKDQFTSSGEHKSLLDRLTDRAIVVSRRRVPVVGGLLPSATIAAQAGAIDPTVTAMAFSKGDQHRHGFYGRRVPSTEIRPAGRPCPSP
jgi:hypothetical protein